MITYAGSFLALHYGNRANSIRKFTRKALWLMGVDVRFFPILIEAMAAVMELGRRLDVQRLLPHLPDGG